MTFNYGAEKRKFEKTWAKLAKAKIVTEDFVNKALQERIERIKKYDEKYLEMIKEND